MSGVDQTTWSSGERCLPAEEDVCAYLNQHTMFFAHHPELLDILQVPHETGESVSLVMAQMCRLRERTLQLEVQLEEMLATARANDVLYKRLQEITLFLLTARSYAVAEAGLLKQLKELFELDTAVLRIVEPLEIDRVESEHTEAETAVLSMIEKGEPRYEIPDVLTASYLWEGLPGTGNIASCLHLPLKFENLRGVLVLGSSDAGRFKPGMEHAFLHQMAEIIAVRIHALY